MEDIKQEAEPVKEQETGTIQPTVVRYRRARTAKTTQLRYEGRPLYRLHFPLYYKNRGLPKGTLHRLEGIEGGGIEKLLKKGTISEVQAPPLFALPGWARRAEKLAEAGIDDAAKFLGVDEAQAAEYMGVKRETVARWKDEVETWLRAPERSK